MVKERLDLLGSRYVDHLKFKHLKGRVRENECKKKHLFSESDQLHYQFMSRYSMF